jgi:hypothetical protein
MKYLILIHLDEKELVAAFNLIVDDVARDA